MQANYKMYSPKYKGSQIWNNHSECIINCVSPNVFRDTLKSISKYSS